jgi:MFS family permease
VICGVACIGFAFDTYELLVLTLTVQPALSEFLSAKPGSAEFNRWIGLMFYVPAIAGGIFGLLGGYLIDRFGRRRVLFWSILLFCFSALATTYSTSALQLLVYRCITFVGVSVEFVAATAWLAELFPERDQRETILGFTQVFASTGGILMSGASYLSLSIGHLLPAIRGGHEAWRYTILWGILAGVSDLAKEKRRRNASAPEHSGIISTGVSQDGSVELLHDGLRVRGVIRNVAALCAHHPRRARSETFGARRSAENCERFAGSAGSGQPLRAHPDGGPRDLHSQPQALAAYLSDSRINLDSGRCAASRHAG